MANAIGKVINNITEYIEIKTEQLKLRIVTKLAKMLSGVISLSFLMATGLFFMFFLSFAVGFLLNDVLESTYLGFFIIAGFYLLIIILILILVKTKKIQGWFEQIIIKAAEKGDEQDD